MSGKLWQNVYCFLSTISLTLASATLISGKCLKKTCSQNNKLYRFKTIKTFWRCTQFRLLLKMYKLVFVSFKILCYSYILYRPARHYTLDFAVSLQRFSDPVSCLVKITMSRDLPVRHEVMHCGLWPTLPLPHHHTQVAGFALTVPYPDVPSEPALLFGKDLRDHLKKTKAAVTFIFQNVNLNDDV